MSDGRRVSDAHTRREKFRWKKSLGKGAFGSVFLVQGEQSNEEWVIKRVDLNQKAFENAEMIQRQVSESEILQGL